MDGELADELPFDLTSAVFDEPDDTDMGVGARLSEALKYLADRSGGVIVGDRRRAQLCTSLIVDR